MSINRENTTREWYDANNTIFFLNVATALNTSVPSETPVTESPVLVARRVPKEYVHDLAQIHHDQDSEEVALSETMYYSICSDDQHNSPSSGGVLIGDSSSLLHVLVHVEEDAALSSSLDTLEPDLLHGLDSIS